MSPEDKYKDLEHLFRRLSNVMSQAVSSYYIWVTLTYSRSTIEAGEQEAHKNAEIISFHKYFFIQTERAHLNAFILGLTKFYDWDKRSLSFNTIITKLRKYKGDVTADTIRNVYPGRFKDQDFFLDGYVLFDESDLAEIESLRERSIVVKKKLREIRDQMIAHEDATLPDATFVPLDVEALIEDTQKIFNMLQGRACLTSTDWRSMKEESIHDTQTLLKNLMRGEKQRLKEIQDTYGI